MKRSNRDEVSDEYKRGYAAGAFAVSEAALDNGLPFPEDLRDWIYYDVMYWPRDGVCPSFSNRTRPHRPNCQCYVCARPGSEKTKYITAITEQIACSA